MGSGRSRPAVSSPTPLPPPAGPPPPRARSPTPAGGYLRRPRRAESLWLSDVARRFLQTKGHPTPIDQAIGKRIPPRPPTPSSVGPLGSPCGSAGRPTNPQATSRAVGEREGGWLPHRSGPPV